MGYNELALPVDIPWKRLGVSGDMMDPRYGDLRFPAKWDTSIAVFYHEPVDNDPAYCHRRITYLKVVCTITGFSLPGRDFGILKRLRQQVWGDSLKSFEHVELAATRSYPCHGALLQVGVYPNSPGDVELYDFPYITSTQPRKRELYEVATQSGEIASQSANKLNVNKGQTTTQTTEDYDLELGGGSGGHSGLFGLWSEQHSGEQRQVGTIQRRQTQDQNVSTSDASRDRRESFSYSTSINQLHTLLQSYHLGTNRVMFQLQPVPHMQDEKFSFTGGLRRLEGVQEFFLIVNRPAHIEGLCVEIGLETAHVALKRDYMPRLITITDLFNPGNLEKTEQALGSEVAPAKFDLHRQVRDAWNSSASDTRWAANQHDWVPDPSDQTQFLMSYVPTWVPDVGAQDVALIFEEYDASRGYFFTAARRFCGCWKPATAGDEHGQAPGIDEPVEDDCEVSSPANLSSCDVAPGSVVYSGPFSPSPWADEARFRGLSFNSMTTALNEAFAASLTAPERYPYGEGSFFATEFMLDELADLVHAQSEHLDLGRSADSFEAVRSLISSFAPGAPLERLTARHMCSAYSRDLARVLGLTVPQAAEVRCAVLLDLLTNGERVPEVDIESIARPETANQRRDRLVASARGPAQPSKTTRRRSPR